MTARILISCAALLVSTSAQGAELPNFRWDGSYLGASVSAGWLDNSFRSDFWVVAPDVYRAKPKTLSLHAGYGRMFGSAYLGLEAEAAVLNDGDTQDARREGSGSIIGSPFGGWVSTSSLRAEAFDHDVQAVASLKMRFGYAIGRFLPFVSAGPAAGKIKTRHLWFHATERRSSAGSVTQTAEGELITMSGVDFGYSLGIGSEVALTPRVSLRVGYNFTDLGKRTLRLAGGRGDADIATQLHDARLGISLRF